MQKEKAWPAKAYPFQAKRPFLNVAITVMGAGVRGCGAAVTPFKS